MYSGESMLHLLQTEGLRGLLEEICQLHNSDIEGDPWKK